ncbi:ABC transporter [Photobacterium aquae]|uniref:ABC transporter n=1 Tax=Photobacterium aquae TaxID=1195763 RepID=A0A0J1JTD1_9GAMM|nr:ABC transporter ATP-binding protein [Photobacterium aquae]KLV05542.1 ABC transporter [Photobacterium aquae]
MSSDSPSMILSIQQLSSGFEAISSMSLTSTLAMGQHLAISGPSGCGKSSLLKVLCGLRPALAGRIVWQQQAVTEANLSWWRQQFCYLPQQPVMGAEDVYSVLRLPWRLKATSVVEPTEQQCLQVLEQLDLASVQSKSVNTLSGGEKQRLAIARAVLMQRPLWIMDEPTSALDAASRDRLAALTRQYSLMVVSVSHDPAWVAGADIVYSMEGRNG